MPLACLMLIRQSGWSLGRLHRHAGALPATKPADHDGEIPDAPEMSTAPGSFSSNSNMHHMYCYESCEKNKKFSVTPSVDEVIRRRNRGTFEHRSIPALWPKTSRRVRVLAVMKPSPSNTRGTIAEDPKWVASLCIRRHPLA